jgi:large subunit ribosomal protein L14
VYKPGRHGRTFAGVGDKVLLAIKGQKMHALVVGVKAHGAPFVPRFDTNNVVLLDDKGNPAGNRIEVPIPTMLRKFKKDHSKLLSIATRFV